MTAPTSARVSAFPVILVASVVQGWALYGLHHAVTHVHWPATNAAWLVALYALAIFIPLTLQFLAGHTLTRAHAVIVAVLALAYFYFGWHHGGAVSGHRAEAFVRNGGFLGIGFVMTVHWLLMLPFIQGRLSSGQWHVPYAVWFAAAWRNKLTLAEAALFTGLFWLLLLLWQELFHLLRIDFFRELFDEPLFVYPVTSLVFGLALHLIGSIERLTQAILEQLLNVLKWLATVAGFILALFTVALVWQLPEMVTSGQRAIGAAWLLWLVAVMVLLLNAAYRDGSVDRPYPKWLALALRCVVPLTVVIALTALYALLVRVQHYGITGERVWALIVAGMALVYAVGYSLAAIGKGRWLQSMARVNTIAAIVLIAVLAAALTPLLSPYRLAANSQFELAQRAPQRAQSTNGPDDQSPFHVLRFDTGEYGAIKLRALVQLQTGADSQRIRDAASTVQACDNRWSCVAKLDRHAVIGALIAKLRVFPAEQTLEPALAAALTEYLLEFGDEYVHEDPEETLGVYVDLNGDATLEFAFLARTRRLLYARTDNEWHRVGEDNGYDGIDWQKLSRDAANNPVAEKRKWTDLRIGTQVFRFNEVGREAVSQ